MLVCEKKTLVQTWMPEWENSRQKAWEGRICLYLPFQGLKAGGEAEQSVISAEHPPIESPR